MKKILTLALCLFAGSINAALIDFEGFLGPGQQNTNSNVTPYTEEGFTITSSTPSIFQNDIFSPSFPNLNSNGTDIFGWCGSCTASPVIFTVTNGGVFDLTSIDFSNLQSGTDAGNIDIIGNFLGGGSISTSVDPAVDIWQTVNFVGFSNLTSFTVALSAQGNDAALDNIVVNSTSSIPVPTTLALLGLGLVGMRRLSLKA